MQPSIGIEPFAVIPWYVVLAAEGLACLALILSARTKGSRLGTAGLFAAFLVLQGLLLFGTWNAEGWKWLLFRFLAACVMTLYLRLSIDGTVNDAVYLGAEAFLASEFIAAFEWQIYLFYAWLWGSEQLKHLWIILFDLAVFILLAVLARKINPERGRLQTERKEALTAAFISLTAFFLSNLNYFPILTPFTLLDEVSPCVERSVVSFCGLIGLIAYGAQRKDLRMKRERDLLNDLLESQYQQYERTRESMEVIDRKYHDLKHQIHALRAEETPEKRAAFLDRMEADLKLYSAQIKTGNAVADVILNSKNIDCDHHGIEFHCVADGSKMAFLEATDICSILGNAIDNAIEYEQRLPEREKRLIDVTIFAQKSLLILKFANYFEGSLKLENGIPVTTKENKEFHGLGMKSIRYAAEKYGGTMGVEVRDSWFTLSVLIPIPEGYQAEETTA